LVAQELLKKEVIFQTDIERMIGKRPYEKSHLIAEDKTLQLPSSDIDKPESVS
jgi:hypothetical protein